MEQQYSHCIIVASNYTSNKRLGLHFLCNNSNINEIMNFINNNTKSEIYSAYIVNTDSPTIDSVKKKEKFFEDVNITEGTNKESVRAFFRSIDNQITAFDIALLFLTRDDISYRDLNIYMFHFYCLFLIRHSRAPFRERIVMNENEMFIEGLEKEFLKNPSFNREKKLACKKEEVVFSKFLNCEEGLTEMYNALNIYFELRDLDFVILLSAANGIYTSIRKSKSTKNFIVPTNLIRVIYPPIFDFMNKYYGATKG